MQQDGQHVYYLTPDGKGNAGIDISVSREDARPAIDGDKVILAITGASERDGTLHGRVAEVLGPEGVMHVEVRALAARYGLRIDFPADVEAEAHAIPAAIPEADLHGRLDLRGGVCFTIDPEDAKDFDDAVSIARAADGNYLVGVHIADVGHYVRAGSRLDAEALHRGTSVYLLDGVIPMLPERLSNHLCSLKEGKDRLTFSALLTVSPRGAVKDAVFRKSVIRSVKRFSYEEAQAILDGGDGPCAEELRMMDALARVLTRKRLREGSIDFNLPEVKFVYDARGVPVDILAKRRLQSMRLIEEFMLLANRAAALSVRAQAGPHAPRPFLYRVHDLPDEEKVGELIAFLHHVGVQARLDVSSSASFQAMLEALEGNPLAPVLQDLTIRSMAKAAYSETNIGHFGLGFAAYTHFTSPIRRYPDLIVHRLLARYRGQDGDRTPAASEQQLAAVARRSSERERLAIEAERESVRLKEIEYLQRHLGSEFEGVISAVMSYGFYVELVPSLVEGLVHVRSLDDDYYRYDARRKCLVGERRRRRYALGDEVRVQIARVDLATRRVDFLIAEDE
jgi:ribonuclease R